MHDTLFEVACAYVLQTPSIQAMAKHLGSDKIVAILQDSLSFSTTEIAAICQDAWWRTFATLYCTLAEPSSHDLDERILHELKAAFSQLYFSSFATQQEEPEHKVREQLPTLAIGCLQAVKDSSTAMAASHFSSVDITRFLTPEGLPATGTVRQLCNEFLTSEYPHEHQHTMIALLSHKKMLEYTLLYFFQRRLLQEQKMQQSLGALMAEGLWFSLENPEHTEELLSTNLLRCSERFAQEEKELQTQLAEASQGGDFSAARTLLSQMARRHEQHLQYQALLTQVPQIVVEAQVNWQSMAGDFVNFSKHLGDLFEALHVSLFSPDTLFPRTTPKTPALPSPQLEVVLPDSPPPTPELLSGDDYPYAVASSPTHALPQELPSLLQTHVNAYLDTHLEALINARVEALVDARIEARWQALVSSPKAREATPLVPEATTPLVEVAALAPIPVASVPPLVSVPPPLDESSIAPVEEILEVSTPTREAVPPGANVLEDTLASKSAEGPSLREFCYRAAVEHRLWVEVDEASHSTQINEQSVVGAEAGIAALAALHNLKIHGRSKADKVLSALEDTLNLPLRLLAPDGEVAAPTQSSKSLRVSGGKWAFATGPRLFLVLKPPPKEGATTPWRKYKVLTFGKAFASFFTHTESRPVQLLTARGQYQAHYDSAKHRFSKVGDLLAAHPELQGHDVICLTQQEPDIFSCDIVYQDLSSRLETPDAPSSSHTNLVDSSNPEVLPLLALQEEPEPTV